MERSYVSLSDMNNPRFTDSELIKDEVDDMEECLEHFESGEDSFPISGRTLSENELSEVLEEVRSKTKFMMMFDESYNEDVFVINIPLSRGTLISAEIEQELCFAWGFPFLTTWGDDWPNQITEYSFLLSDLKEKALPIEREELLINRFMGLFFKESGRGGKK